MPPVAPSHFLSRKSRQDDSPFVAWLLVEHRSEAVRSSSQRWELGIYARRAKWAAIACTMALASMKLNRKMMV